MTMAKKVIALLLCAVLLVCASVAGTMAYLTSQDEVVNNFTVGQVKITLDEADVTNTASDAPRVQTNDYHLLPNHKYPKDPTVHVTKGSEDCYVRMFVTITHDDEWNTICARRGIDVTNMFGGYDGAVWVLHSVEPDEAVENTRTYEFWYNTKVTDVPADADKHLDPLFEEIIAPSVLTNEDLALLADKPETEYDEGFKLYVVAQAIQADGFADAAAAFTAAPAITGANLIPGIDTSTP